MGQRWKVDNDFQYKRLLEHIGSLRLAGKNPTIEFITDNSHPKTPQQIRYAHSLIQAVADHGDVSLEAAKRDCKAAFGVVVVSNSAIDGTRSARLVSLADYDKQQMNAFLYGLEVWLSENNIPYTPPEHQ